MGILGITSGSIYCDDQYQQTADKNVGHLCQSLSKDEWDFIDAWFATVPNSGENLSLLAIIASIFRPSAVISDINVKDDGSTDYNATLPGEGVYNFRPRMMIAQITAAVALNADYRIKVGTSFGAEDIYVAGSMSSINAAGESGIYWPTTAATGVRMLSDRIADNSTIHVKVSTPDTGTSGTLRVWVLGKLFPWA